MNRDWLLGSLGTLLFLDVELERQFGYVKVRYRGLAKNTAQLHTLFALSNLWMVRRALLQELRA